MNMVQACEPPLIRVRCPLCDETRTSPERVVSGFALERCCRCGFVFVNPRYANDPLLGQYHKDADAQLDIWERITTPTMIADYERMLKNLEEALPGQGRLLDFGCGPCYFLACAARRGWDAHGVELGAWSRQAAQARGVSKRLHVGLLADQNFPDTYFDVIYSNQVFEHLAQPRDDLRELQRILRPGGILYLNVPNYHRLPVMLDMDDFMLDTPMGHVNYFTPQTLKRLVTTGGFRVLRVATYGGVKWENLLGLPTRGEVVDAVKAHHANGVTGNGSNGASRDSAKSGRPLLLRMLSPLLKALVYRWAKLGLTLELIARRS
jgi:SAM-dependent methyltransferase